MYSQGSAHRHQRLGISGRGWLQAAPDPVLYPGVTSASFRLGDFCRNAPSHCAALGSVTRWWPSFLFLQGTTRDARHRNRGWRLWGGRSMEGFKMLRCGMQDAGCCLVEKERCSGLDPDRHGADTVQTRCRHGADTVHLVASPL